MLFSSFAYLAIFLKLKEKNNGKNDFIYLFAFPVTPKKLVDEVYYMQSFKNWDKWEEKIEKDSCDKNPYHYVSWVYFSNIKYTS